MLPYVTAEFGDHSCYARICNSHSILPTCICMVSIFTFGRIKRGLVISIKNAEQVLPDTFSSFVEASLFFELSSWIELHTRWNFFIVYKTFFLYKCPFFNSNKAVTFENKSFSKRTEMNLVIFRFPRIFVKQKEEIKLWFWFVSVH